MSASYPPAIRRRAIDLVREGGLSHAATSLRDECTTGERVPSRRTLANWAKDDGLNPSSQEDTKKTEAARAELRRLIVLRREAIHTSLLDKVGEALSLMSPARSTADWQKLATTIGILLDKSLKLDPVEKEPSVVTPMGDPELVDAGQRRLAVVLSELLRRHGVDVDEEDLLDEPYIK